MHPFHVADMSPEAFVEKVRQDLAQRGLEEYVSVRREDEELVIRVSWMGRSVLRYHLHADGRGFRAEPGGHRVAPLHQAFVDTFEDRFEHVLEKVGATPG